jgi:hypothetical protein
MDAYTSGAKPSTAATATAANALLIYGRSLTHRHKSEAERVEIAVAILEGRANVVDPCLLQVARQCNLSPAKVRAALRRRTSNGHAETLAQHMERAPLAEWQQAARIYGVDRIWDQMIAPVVAEERAAADPSNK